MLQLLSPKSNLHHLTINEDISSFNQLNSPTTADLAKVRLKDAVTAQHKFIAYEYRHLTVNSFR